MSTSPPTNRLSTILSGIAGEYFVAAELSRRGFTAAITLRNTRGADILATKQDSKRSATIQVKCAQRKATEWLLDKSDEVSKGLNHFYVFVALNGLGAPSYYIVSGKAVAETCASHHQEWLRGKKKRRPGTQRHIHARVSPYAIGSRSLGPSLCVVIRNLVVQLGL